jgi:steroid 5-alpha reductase family enzyme
MLFAVLILLLFFHLLFVWALIARDNSIADIGWGLGFVLVDLTLWSQSNFHSLPQLIMSILIVIWGVRLSSYIFLRKWGKPEDFRYQQWRVSWGKYFIIRSYFQIFLLQMSLLLLIALPLFLVFNQAATPTVFTIIGASIALAGLVIEIISDWQMAQFKKNPLNHGKIIQTGLWNYSRHPNYFGEATFWWGIAGITFPIAHHFLWLISPLLITILVRYVSGVPLLEKKYQNHPDFPAYAAQTSCFILWFKRKRA